MSNADREQIVHQPPSLTRSVSTQPLLSYAFRPLFLGLALFAVLAMAVWIAALSGRLSMAVHFGPLWHSHEMLFGFALAAVAGFVLTAVATWTDREPVHGGELLLLTGAWLAGRLALSLGGPPAAWSALLALLFPVMLCGFATREIWRGRSRRNYPIAAIIALLALLDVLFHLGALGLLPGAARLAPITALYLLVILVSVIGGRIIPAFTGNWLRGHGSNRLPQHTAIVERWCIPLTAITATLLVTVPHHIISGLVAACTAGLHMLRLARWCGLSARREPLLFVLHVAYAWLPLGFALISLSILNGAVPYSSGLHALGAGALSTMILAVASRVALGHTGRPLHAARITVIAYIALNTAALIRVLAPLGGAQYLLLIEIAAAGWAGAWLLFLWVYAPILVKPRQTQAP